jgi:hypothetical protein
VPVVVLVVQVAMRQLEPVATVVSVQIHIQLMHQLHQQA